MSIQIFGAPKRRAKDEYESDFIDDEDDEMARQEAKRKKKLVVKRRPGDAADKRVEYGGSKLWHSVFGKQGSPYNRLVFQHNWALADAAQLKANLAAVGSNPQTAAALWIETTMNTPLKKDDRDVLQAAKSAPGGESLIAVLGLLYIAIRMPEVASEAARAAFDQEWANEWAFEEVPYHWQEAADERGDAHQIRAEIAQEELVPFLMKAARAIRKAFKDGDNAAMVATLSSLNSPDLPAVLEDAR